MRVSLIYCIVRYLYGVKVCILCFCLLSYRQAQILKTSKSHKSHAKILYFWCSTWGIYGKMTSHYHTKSLKKQWKWKIRYFFRWAKVTYAGMNENCVYRTQQISRDNKKGNFSLFEHERMAADMKSVRSSSVLVCDSLSESRH